jgi:hypothetical protein
MGLADCVLLQIELLYGRGFEGLRFFHLPELFALIVLRLRLVVGEFDPTLWE